VLGTEKSLLEASMCLAKLYPPGAQRPVMENIAQITIENGKIIVETLFGEIQTFEDKIQMISFTESRVQLVESDG
jgi:predicted RNA-binding protein